MVKIWAVELGPVDGTDKAESDPNRKGPPRSVARKVGGDTVGQFLGRVIAAAASVVALRLATVALGPTRYGHVAIALSLFQILSGIADFGLLTVITRDMSVADAETAADIMRTAFWLRLCLGVASSVVLVVIAALAFGHEPGVLTGVLMLSPVLVTRALDLTFTAWYAARTRVAIPTVIVATLQVLSLPVLWLLFRNGAGGIAYLGVTSAAAVLAGIAIAACSRCPLVLKHPILKGRGTALLRTALPLGLVTVVNMVYLRLDGIILALERPAAQVAYYSVAYRVTDFVVGLPALLMIALIPSLAQAPLPRRLQMVQRALDSLIVAAVVLALSTSASAHLIVGVLGGSKFYPAARPLAVLSVGAAISFASAVYGHSLVVFHQQRGLFGIITTITVVNLLTNLLLIPIWGSTGAAVAFDLSELVGLVLLDRAFRQASSAGPSWHQLWRIAPPTLIAVATWLALSATVHRTDQVLWTGVTLAAVGLIFVVLSAATGALRPFNLPGRFLPGRHNS